MDSIDLAVAKLLAMTSMVNSLPTVQASIDRIFKVMIATVDFPYPKIDWNAAIGQECR